MGGALAGCESPPSPLRADQAGLEVYTGRSTPVETPFDPKKPLSLEECVKAAESSSPTARAFRARLEAARAVVVAAETWPNPIAEWGGEDFQVKDRSSQDPLRNFRSQFTQHETLSYPIFTCWTKGLEVDAAKAQETRDAAGVEEDKRQLRFEVGRAYYELLSDQEAVGLGEEGLAAAEKLSQAAEKRRAVGESSGLDARRAKTEALVAKRDLALATRKRDLDSLAFSLVLGASLPVAVSLKDEWPEALPEDIAPIASPSDYAVASPDTRVAGAIARRPDIKAAEAEVLRAQTASDLEGRRALPLNQINVAAGAREGPNGLGAVVTVNGPIPLLDRNQGARRKAAADLEAALADLERVRRKAALEIRAAIVEWTRSRETVTDFARPIVEGREAALEATRRLFGAGEVSYLDVVSAQRDAVLARRDLLDARKDAALARWRLVVAVGAP